MFYRKTRAQQEAALKKFHNLPVKTEDLLSIDLNESNSESNEITTTPLSVPLENCGIIRVPFSILARQYNRAASVLVGKEQNIISDPGKGDNLPRYVANESVNTPSYVVSKKRSVRHGAYYVCSASCIDFKAYDICAHTLAVAEMDSSLTEFIKCYKATNQGPPKVDALINIDLPTGRGSKKTKSTQRRRGAVNSNTRRKDVVECYTETSGPSSSTSGIDYSSVGNRGDTDAETITKTRTSTSSKGSQV